MKGGSASFGTQAIPQLLIKQAVPASIGILVMSLNILIDTIFVGQWIGANAIAPLLPGRPERLGIELELPIKTHVSGVQMTPRWQLTVGLQKSF